MKKALLRLTSVEYEYNRQFGICPEYHWMKLKESGISSEECTKIIDKNMQRCTEIVDARNEKERIEEERKRSGINNHNWEWIVKTDNCPF